MRNFVEIHNINILGFKSHSVNIFSINTNNYGDGKKLFVIYVRFKEVTQLC
jgi:hypothetical protein